MGFLKFKATVKAYDPDGRKELELINLTFTTQLTLPWTWAHYPEKSVESSGSDHLVYSGFSFRSEKSAFEVQ